MQKTAYSRMNHQNSSKRKKGAGFKESHPTIDKEPKFQEPTKSYRIR